MPTYDYQCDGCGHEFELFQSISESVKRKCPACGKFKLRRLFGTGAAVVFKGSGFYQTDYRSKEYKESAAADKKAASESNSDNSDNRHFDLGGWARKSTGVGNWAEFWLGDGN